MLRDNDFHDELDPAFIARYKRGRPVIDDEPYFAVSEDDEADPWEILDETVAEEPVLDPVERRQLYQRNYRLSVLSGKHTPTEAKTLTRFGEDKRKKLTYYLSPAVKEAFEILIKKSKHNKRTLCSQALEEYLASGEQPQASDEVFTKRIFMYDEVTENLWLRVQAICRDSKGKKVAKHYVVVEAAILRMLRRLKEI